VATLLPLALGLAGCRSAEKYSAAADEEVYEVLAAKFAEFEADVVPFRIDPPEDSLRQRLLLGEDPPGPLGLSDCLAIAAENSREYRAREEQLYLAALSFTFERYLFSTRYGSSLAGAAGGDLNGTSSSSGSFGAGLERLLATGTEVLFDATFSLARDFVAGGGWNSASLLSLSIRQPLLRGSAREVVLEPLTQAERDVVYAMRDFERFRHTFAFDVADRLYRILQQMDTLGNEEQNEEGLRVLRERNEALGEAGRLADIQVDQARQDELRARNRVIEAHQRLDGLLDDFKLFLGLPVETPLELSRDELDALVAAELTSAEHSEDELVLLALDQRVDYQSAVGRLTDEERRVRVAADALRAGLDLTTAFTTAGDGGQVLAFGGKTETTWSAALVLDLPLDRFGERNALREAEIGVQDARRGEQELADRIRADVRQGLRDLEAARETHTIQERSVELADRRIESTRLSLEAGRAETRDLLEAQEAQLTARNAATSALIDYRLASLALVRDAGCLRIGPSGLEVAPLFEDARGGE
jgi:outer membrane protein TolC